MRNRRWLAAPGALILGVAATACATLPTSGRAQLNTLQGSGGQAQQGVQIVPAPPGPGWSPTDIVNGFIAASASFDRHNHAVAREYLTRKFNRSWGPRWAATIIDSPNVVMASPGKPISNPGTPAAVVDVTGKRFSKLQAPGQDQAGSVVVSPGVNQYTFSLVHLSAGWRIDGILDGNKKPVKPTLLLLTSTDFARDYLPRNLYFYQPRRGATALVPDPVYIPPTGPKTEVKGLVKALIHPPPPTSWLWDAATTAFPPGTKLIKTQIIGGIQAVITIGGAALRADRDQQKRMAAQLNWSLTQSPYATQYPSPIKQVVLRIGNQLLRSRQGQYDTWVPRGVTSPLYYQVGGAGQSPAVAALRPRSPTPVAVPLPAGLGNQPFTAMAVSTAQPGQPTIAGCVGRNLYLIKLAAGVLEGKNLSAASGPPAVRKSLPASCTSLSWDARGELWVTAKSHTLVLPVSGATALAKAGLVPVLRFVLPMAITSMRVAPDGVRVAMIVGTGPAKRILLGAISRKPQSTYISQTGQTLRVGSDIADPVALNWVDPDNLLVLSKSATGRTQLFEVPLNGGQSTQLAIPGGVTSVAASWPSGQRQPHVVIGIAPTVSSPGTIETSKLGLPNTDWLPVEKGTTPVFPG